MKFIEKLKLPETRYISDLDHPSTTMMHAGIIQKKPFLRKLYIEFYRYFLSSIPDHNKFKVLVELGSGGGFIKEVIPDIITSDVLCLDSMDKCFSALDMPFGNNTVDAFFMIDVLHHINDSRAFFRELNRCLRPGGKVVMIEPANTVFSRFIYKNFHHERFDTSGGWGFEETGPLSSANGAIPWIIFCRDRAQFEKEFPALKIRVLKPYTPFRYLISGGLSMRQLLPSFTYNMVKGIEFLLSPVNSYLGMFLKIELEKQP